MALAEKIQQVLSEAVLCTEMTHRPVLFWGLSCPVCERVATDQEALDQAWDALVTWTPELVPEQFRADNPYYTEGDERAPFFSEAYLYTLLGKDAARSLLGRLSVLGRVAGLADERWMVI
ncbi:MAG: hypothetical protein L0191_09845 [Acidobacteria bacterium]|nr:hypothetical protein [Acidobacteriota bacterium]